VTAEREGSSPFNPPNFVSGALGKPGLSHLNFDGAPIFGVWCNVSIRVLGTRGDSSILSTPTIHFVLASLVQLVQDTALPALRHRFDSGTMLQHLLSFARVAKWLRRRIANPVLVSSSLTARSNSDH
jgi:hypothetical protein